MIHGLLFGIGLCAAPFVLGAIIRGWRWILLGGFVLLSLAALVIAHATGLADWRLVGLAWVLGSGTAFLALPWIGFEPLRTALFLNAGLVAVAVFLVQHTVPAGA